MKYGAYLKETVSFIKIIIIFLHFSQILVLVHVEGHGPLRDLF